MRDKRGMVILGTLFLAFVLLVLGAAQYRHVGAILLTVTVVIYLCVRRLGNEEAKRLSTRTTVRWRERIMIYLGRRTSVTEEVPVLIYGAGRRGKSILQELRENRALGLRSIGFVDDDPSLIGFTIKRVRVLGSSRDLAVILNSQKVSALIISSYKITGERLLPVMTICSTKRIPVLRGEFQLDRVSGVGLCGTRDTSDSREQSATGPEKINAPEPVPTVKETHGVGERLNHPVSSVQGVTR
jgi:FlaA1/EpsC-like NDP-sugar epimerase